MYLLATWWCPKLRLLLCVNPIDPTLRFLLSLIFCRPRFHSSILPSPPTSHPLPGFRQRSASHPPPHVALDQLFTFSAASTTGLINSHFFSDLIDSLPPSLRLCPIPSYPVPVLSNRPIDPVQAPLSFVALRLRGANCSASPPRPGSPPLDPRFRATAPQRPWRAPTAIPSPSCHSPVCVCRGTFGS